MLMLLLLLLQTLVQSPRPSQTVPDPGVIATDQRITPAGVQSAFEGRVSGVRFGASAREVWVAVPGEMHRLDLGRDRVAATAKFDGRPGVHGVAIDPATGRVLVSSVGRLPSDIQRTPGAPRAKAVSQVLFYDGAATGTLAVHHGTRALGSDMIGAPAVARTSTQGPRLAVVPLPANDALAVLNADTGALLDTIALGVLPVSAVISDDGRTAWVSLFGGPKPAAGDRAALQCCDPMAERVRVDARGIAERGSVVRVDLVSRTVAAVIPVGLHPSGLAYDRRRELLYAANGNSDDVSVIETRTDRVVTTLAIAPFQQRLTGLAPTAVAVSPNGRRLYVALGGVNAVAVYDVQESAPRLLGLIPTGWYPSSLDVSGDGRALAVGTLLGVGSGTGETVGMRGRYVHAVRGSVNVVDVSSDAPLAGWTASVAQNNRLALATGPDAPSVSPRAGVAPRAVPERPGEPSPIQHVVFIIRENRTYDQVLGDLGRGAGDPSLVMYNRGVTPNAHALAEQFVVLDHFFASGGNSADGHQWLTQANETDYPMWPLYYGRSYPSEGVDPLAYSSGGFIWEAARAKGLGVSVFGEYAPAPKTDRADFRSTMLAQWRDSQPHDPAVFRRALADTYNTHSDIPSLDALLVREYPGWSMETPDVAKADVILEHLREWEAQKKMPNLTMVILPSDHTSGTSAGWCTPSACVADNDLALGKIVEGLSHSSFWPSMAIMVVEDDAQNGVDHIDGHRTVALVASPYARRGIVDSTFYSQPSMVKSIELMLGLPALSLFDLVATDMRASFIGEGESPNFAPFTALQPTQSLYAVNPKPSSISGAFASARQQAARESGRMNFSEPDAAPSDRLNVILWHDARGWGTRYPGVKRSLFFPLAVDLSDDEREERGKREVRVPRPGKQR